MSSRDPRTPDCSIRGCTRAARQLGMCKPHASLAPPDAGVLAATAAFTAAHKAGQRRRDEARKHVEKVLRQQRADARTAATS